MQGGFCLQRIQASWARRRRGTQQRRVHALLFLPTVSKFDVCGSLEEHAEVKRQVYAADSHDFDAPDYGDVMAKAVTTFIDHALEEEEQQFSMLKAKLPPEESDVRVSFIVCK